MIQPEQAERIAAHALAPRGMRHLQTALALCILLLVAPSVIAFVAANWSAMPPSGRLIVLFLANAAAVSATYLAAQRRARDPAGTSHRLAMASRPCRSPSRRPRWPWSGRPSTWLPTPAASPGPSRFSAWRRRSSRDPAVRP
ncbi:DUF2157 domain-containing protein [Methylobacterium tardum]|uniref:DUF2157 domain-containing protein n=1 Tax=Methylobacterium tardum TaxID=374432 RepID=UPI002021C740|nr:DUF2157 domain-containing protein [Methylobacterium tardum]URD37468.1 DUF2157 domain-containing protein [Methylobacterium tardum]